LPAVEPAGGWPSLAVAFAARDEEADVGRAARSMLALDYPNLRVVAVDDRSTDATGAILDALAAEDGRLVVVHVRELPPGWLGKCHALQAAADAVGDGADWLLFTDADVVFAPDALRRAVAFALSERADHVTVAPGIPTEGPGERLFLVMFLSALTVHAAGWRIEDDESRPSMGIGAFTLVRAEVFRAIGGFRRLALSVDDDVQLGRAIKWAGYRSRIILGAEAVRVRWQVGLGGMIRGLEKNFFAAARFRLALALMAIFPFAALGIAPFVGMFVGPWWSRAVSGLGYLA